MAEWPCCHDPLRSSPTLHRFRPHLFPCRTSMPFSPLSLQSPCLASTGNSGLPSFGGRGGGQHGGQASKRGGGGGNPEFPQTPREITGSPVPRREQGVLCAGCRNIGEIWGSPDALPGRNWCGEIRDSPDALPKRNWCARVQRNSGFPRRSSLAELVPVRGIPNGIGASAGKFGVPSTPFPNGIGSSVGKFGVPMPVHTESAPGLRDPPVYMSGRNSCQA